MSNRDTADTSAAGLAAELGRLMGACPEVEIKADGGTVAYRVPGSLTWRSGGTLTYPAHAALLVGVLANAPLLLAALGRAAEAERLRVALDIETLRGPYHDASFLDPPSYHEELPDDASLWDCPQCVERYIERARRALGGADG